jgi:hypothetical protein
VNKAPGVFHEGLSCTRLERMHNLRCGRNFTTNENQTFKYWMNTAWTTHTAGGWNLLRQKKLPTFSYSENCIHVTLLA